MLFSAPTHRTPTKPWDTNHSNFLSPPQSNIWGQVVCRKTVGEKNEMGRAWRITLVWKILAIGSPAKPDVNLPWSSRRRQLFRLLATFIFLVRSLSKSGSRLSLPEKRYDCDLLKRTIQVENHLSTHNVWNLWRDVPNVLVIMKEYFIIQKKTNTSLKFWGKQQRKTNLGRKERKLGKCFYW